DCFLLFRRSIRLRGVFSDNVFLTALGGEVRDATADDQNGEDRGNNNAKRARLFFAVASFNLTLEMGEGFFATLFITTSHRVVLSHWLNRCTDADNPCFIKSKVP